MRSISEINVYPRVAFLDAKVSGAQRLMALGTRIRQDCSLVAGLKIHHSKHYECYVVHLVERCWMPAVKHGEIT